MNGEKLKELRLKKHISIKELSDYLDVSERTYQSYERSERDPSTTTLAKLVVYFGVSADYLIDVKDKPEPPSITQVSYPLIVKELKHDNPLKLDQKTVKKFCKYLEDNPIGKDDSTKHCLYIDDDKSARLIVALEKCTDALKRIQPEEGSLEQKENRLLAVFKKLSEKQQDNIITSAELLAEANK